MAKLAPVRPAELIRFFRTHGWREARTRGSHRTMTKPGAIRPITIPLHRTVSVGVIRTNLKTAGLAPADLLRFLAQGGKSQAGGSGVNK